MKMLAISALSASASDRFAANWFKLCVLRDANYINNLGQDCFWLYPTCGAKGA